MSDVIQRTKNRLLAQRVKAKFAKPEDVANVRVMTSGVVAVGGQTYNSDTAGQRPGTVVKAVNVGSKANAHWRAQFGASDTNGLNGQDVKRMIDKALQDLLASNDFSSTVNNVTTPTDPNSNAATNVTVTPSNGVSASAFATGTFSGSQVYTITNNGTTSVDWTVTKGEAYTTLSATSGTLAAGANTTVTVSIDGTEAATLTGGTYYDIVIFNANGISVASRMVQINVINPTIDDVVRGVIPATRSTGDTLTFTIPSWAQVGDLILLYSYNRTFSSYIDTLAGWTNYSDQTDMAVDPGGSITTEFPGSTWHQYYHIITTGEPGTDVTLTYKWAYEGIGPNPVTFANPVISAVIFKGDANLIDGFYGGVGYDFEYDDADTTYSEPYQAIIYFRGLYDGEAATPPIGVTELVDDVDDSSIFIGAKMRYGAGSDHYSIESGKVGIWAIDAANLVTI